MRIGRGLSKGHLANRSVSGGMRACRSLYILLVIILLCLSFNSALSLSGPSSDALEPEKDASSLIVDSLSFVVSPARAYPGDPVKFYVNATSSDPTAIITVTIYYDYKLSDGVTINPYSPVSVNVTGTPANVVTSYTYDHIGNLSDPDGFYFQLRANADDGETTWAKSDTVHVGNAPPSLQSKPEPTIRPDYNRSKNMSFIVKDWDNELVTATWNFGDGTDPVVNETIATPTGSYIWQNHTWYVALEPGRGGYDILFNMSVSFLDSFGNVMYSNHTVNMTAPPNAEPDFSFTAASAYSSPDVELPFYANATDPEGDSLTWTFVFNNSVEDYLTEVYHTDPTAPTTTVWQNISHAFPALGVYNITLFISDALPPYQTRSHNQSQTIKVTVADNRAPGVLANITVLPTTPRINSTLGYAQVLVSIQANDADGDVLSLSWDFGDGEGADNVSLGGIQVYTFRHVHNYTVGGSYNVTVTVNDGHGHSVLRYKQVVVLTDNRAPTLVSVDFEMSNRVFALPGSTVNLTIVLSDAELDPITVWVDFGDNSSIVRVNLTEFTDNKTVSALIKHVYNVTGKYNVTLTFTDGMFGPTHNVSVTLPVEVKIPRVIVIRVWDWWDYTSLSLVGVGLGLIMLRWYAIGRFRKELDTKGMTVEEYNIIVKELREQRKADLRKIDVQVEKEKLDPVRAKKMRADIRDNYRKSRVDLRAGKRVEIEAGW